MHYDPDGKPAPEPTRPDGRQKAAPRIDIDEAEFVEVWNNSDSQRQAAEHFGLSVSAATSRADRAKQAGYDVKSHRDERRQAFIDLWNSADNAQQVADSIGKTKHNVQSRASRLRKAGYPLKVFLRHDSRKLN